MRMQMPCGRILDRLVPSPTSLALLALLALSGCEGTEYSREAEDERGQREVTDVTSAGAPNSERAPESDRANATAEELLAPGDHGAYDDDEQ